MNICLFQIMCLSVVVQVKIFIYLSYYSYYSKVSMEAHRNINKCFTCDFLQVKTHAAPSGEMPTVLGMGTATCLSHGVSNDGYDSIMKDSPVASGHST